MHRSDSRYLAPPLRQEMDSVSVGLGPNVVAYGAAMSALANGKQWKLALELLDEVGDGSGVRCALDYSTTVAVAVCFLLFLWGGDDG